MTLNRYMTRSAKPAISATLLVALISLLIAPSAGAQQPGNRTVWLPMVVRGPTVCNTGPVIFEVPVSEPGISNRYFRWPACPWSEVYVADTYIDGYGQTHTTYSLPEVEGRWRYTPRWQIWRGGEWVESTESEFMRERGRAPGTVRMYVTVAYTGQNYTLATVVGRP